MKIRSAILYLVAIACLVLGSSSAFGQDFSGTWQWFANGFKGELYLTQSGSQIRGWIGFNGVNLQNDVIAGSVVAKEIRFTRSSPRLVRPQEYVGYLLAANQPQIEPALRMTGADAIGGTFLHPGNPTAGWYAIRTGPYRENPAAPPPPPPSSLTGNWRIELSIPQGQPFAGTYILNLDLVERNGQLTGTGTWNTGVVSKFTGSIAGVELLLNRLDTDGYRMRMVGRAAGTDRFQGTFDQATNGATGQFVMTRATQSSTAAPAANSTPSLTGNWRIELSIPQGQPFAGTYILNLDLVERNGQLTGTGTWNTGVVSTFTGSIAGGQVLLNRLDTDGFRARMVGRGVDTNRFQGTFDQATNGSTGPFVMTRAPQR
jgi:hypothetical protein